MKILAIDSSAITASVAVIDDGKLVGEFFLNTGLTHSRTLLPMLESVVSCADLKLSDIDLFAVSNGPGSFTGVRIGVSAIKGIAEAIDKPCLGVSTLLAMAHNIKINDSIICCVMDARCNQVYTALFKSVNGKVERITDDDAMSIDELSDRLSSIDDTIYLVGDGAKLCCTKLSEKHIKLKLLPENVLFQRAYGVAAAVYENEANKFATYAEKLSVSYLRLSQAERERNAKLEAEK